MSDACLSRGSALKTDKNQSVATVALRRRAELVIGAKAPAADVPLSADETQRLLHELQVHQVDLNCLAEEVALDLKVTEPERQVTFRITAGIMADGDATLLRMVLDNLLGNAWKHSGHQEETVIDFGVTQAGGQPAYFVRDNGAGFDMALADKLFLPFQRLPGTEVEGHGIGLATVVRIVSRHGGRVWAESKPSAGATFYFTLA